MTPEQLEARARRRFFIITITRISGVVLAMVGLVASVGRIEGVPPVAGYVLLALGMFDIAFVPRILARRWRTPPAA